MIPLMKSRFQGREHGEKKRTENQKVARMLKQLRQFGDTIFIETCISWQWTLWKLGVIIQSMISLKPRGVHCTTVWGRCAFFTSVLHSSLAVCGGDLIKERMKMPLCAPDKGQAIDCVSLPCYLEVYQHLTVNDAQLYRRYLGDCLDGLWFYELHVVVNVLLVYFFHKPDWGCLDLMLFWWKNNLMS